MYLINYNIAPSFSSNALSSFRFPCRLPHRILLSCFHKSWMRYCWDEARLPEAWLPGRCWSPKAGNVQCRPLTSLAKAGSQTEDSQSYLPKLSASPSIVCSHQRQITVVPTVFTWNHLAIVAKCQDSTATGWLRPWSTRNKMAAAGF